ncbi:MAG: hypothetical protein JWO53_116 [Chlamydiia bacterium]|nr:hypothetical protein [Chlamydiia bacterium]
MIKKFYALFVILSLTMTLSHASEKYQCSDAERDFLLSLDWESADTFSLPLSHSIVSLPLPAYAVFDDDARQFCNRLDTNCNAVEAVLTIMHPTTTSCLVFESFNEGGYISIDDWHGLDTEQLLVEMNKVLEKDNVERRKNNFPELFLTRWVHEPDFDVSTHTVYLAVEQMADEIDAQPYICTIALRLSRTGYERITWVITDSRYVSLIGELPMLLKTHSFDEGYRYSDYIPGDKKANQDLVASLAELAMATK